MKNQRNPLATHASPPQPSATPLSPAVDPAPDSVLPPIAPAPAPVAVATQPLADPPAALRFTTATLESLANRPARKPRNGRIAHLPRLERDMVNRMLANNLPHRAIVAALDECGIRVTERNVSNWKTRGGYDEWRAAQAQALELRTFQDNLTDFLRRHDAAELPEVGLQSAATTLSALLLRPDLMRQLLDAPDKYAKLIDLQCRLARQIQALQKDRDAAACALGRQYVPERVKRESEREVDTIRETYSSKLGKGPNDRDIPHRNFIPKEIDPIEPLPQPLDFAELLRRKTLAANHLPPAPSPSNIANGANG